MRLIAKGKNKIVHQNSNRNQVVNGQRPAEKLKSKLALRDKNDDGVLVKVKLRMITLALDEDSDVDTLLTKAVETHARHHKQIDKDCKYVLLYHDMSMVKNLPQSNTPFVLSKYQKDLLISY